MRKRQKQSNDHATSDKRGENIAERRRRDTSAPLSLRFPQQFALLWFCICSHEGLRLSRLSPSLLTLLPLLHSRSAPPSASSARAAASCGAAAPSSSSATRWPSTSSAKASTTSPRALSSRRRRALLPGALAILSVGSAWQLRRLRCSRLGFAAQGAVGKLQAAGRVGAALALVRSLASGTGWLR